MKKTWVLRLLANNIIFSPLFIVKDWWWWFKGAYRKSYAQHGEDTFVLDYFSGKIGKYMDVGANHPYKLSNTYLLYKNNWRGINVEPIPYLYKNIKKNRPQDINLNVGVGREKSSITFYEMQPTVLSTFNHDVYESLITNGQAVLRNAYKVPVVTVTDIYREHMLNQNLDLLLIDTEGFEIEVLNGIDWELVRPQLVIIEATTISEIGNSDEITEYLVRNNYKMIKVLGCNRVFEYTL